MSEEFPTEPVPQQPAQPPAHSEQPAPHWPPYPAHYPQYTYPYGQPPGTPPVDPAAYATYEFPQQPNRSDRLRKPWARRGIAILGAAAVIVGAGAGGYALHNGTTAGTPVAGQQQPSVQTPGTNNGGSSDNGSGNGGWDWGSGGWGNGQDPFGNGTSQLPNTNSSQQATDTQSVGIVDINVKSSYDASAGAGTGMVLTSDGYVLTNNHVVDGATDISVTVVSTGKTYTAKVVGTAPTKDVAVIKLDNASGLQTAKIGSSSGVKTGDAVTAVGNAGGTGGTPSAASGKVVALDQTITASDEDGSNSETLNGLIEVDAPIEPGDSGGATYDASDSIVGMNTAAQTSRNGTTVVGYAIPIDTAKDLAQQIMSGQGSDTVHIGLPSFLGVSVNTQVRTAGAAISGVLQGGPAAKIGLAAGDTITKVGGKAVANGEALRTALQAYQPGDSVKITWKDASGQTHSATADLIEGPAD